jgi:hypothetical protein
MSANALEPYKRTIDRWLRPDVFRRQDTSVSKAKQAISDYKKALGHPEGVAEFSRDHHPDLTNGTYLPK